MATTTLNRLVELLARSTGFYHEGTATGSHSTSTLQDTTASGFNKLDDNIIKGKWLTITDTTDDAAPEAESNKILSVSTTTATVDTVYSAAPANSDTYEITPFMRQYYVDAVQAALKQVYPSLYIPLRDETLVVDNLLLNWDFETSTTGPVAFTSWTSAGSPTLYAEANRIKHGSQSMRVVAGGSDGVMTQNLFTIVNVHEVVGKTLYLRGHVWASAANEARMRVTFDGSTYSDGPWHGGSDEWEGPTLQYLHVGIPADAEQITVVLQTVAGATVYWDAMHAYIDRVSQYTLPTTFVTSPHRISIQNDLNDPSGYYEPLTCDAVPGHILRLEGRGQLSVPDATEATTEIDEKQAELIIALAARALFIRMGGIDATKRDEYREDVARWSEEASRLTNTPGVRMSGQAAALPKAGEWRIEADASGRYLNLPR